jgi:hypothetical protein
MLIKTSKTRFSRRRLLRGTLGAGLAWLALPRLNAYAATCDNGFPPRFGIWMWGNGNRPDQWTPGTEGFDWEPSEELAPLLALRDKVTVVSGMTVKINNTNPHWSGCTGLLAGHSLVDQKDPTDGGLKAPTIDQLLAAEIGGDTLYRSLEIGVGGSECFSYTDPVTNNPAEADPYALYERLFGETFREPGEGGLVDPTLGYRRSALDAVMGDLTTLQGELGVEDQARLEQHLDGVRDIETRLARLQEDPPDLAACVRADEPLAAYPEIDGRPQLAEINAVMSQMTALALACDMTRVFNYAFSRPLYSGLFPDASEGHHALSHDEPGDQPEMNAIATYTMEQFAVFLAALDAIPEGDGTLLDNCLVLACSETSEGRTHSVDEIPLLIGGGGCGRIVPGYHYRSHTQENASKVILSLLRAMDLPLASWGDEDAETSDGLGGIEL